MRLRIQILELKINNLRSGTRLVASQQTITRFKKKNSESSVHLTELQKVLLEFSGRSILIPDRVKSNPERLRDFVLHNQEMVIEGLKSEFNDEFVQSLSNLPSKNNI